MKNKNIIFILIFISIAFLASCDVLDQSPEMSITDDQAFVSKSSTQAALMGVYSGLQSGSYYGRDYVALGYLPGDNVEWSGSFSFYQQVDANRLTADNSTITGVWRAIYSTINSANHVIAKVQAVSDPTFSQQEKDQVQGEAYFIRALAYFDLARGWGGVPLVLTFTQSPNDGEGIGRSTLEDTYAQVLEDLITAESLLTDDVIRNRATQHSVHALRARLHLYLEQWEEAERYASLLIEHPSFELVQPYEAFIQNKNSEESILELAYDNANRNNHNGYFLPANQGGRLEWRPTTDLIDLVRDEQIGGDRSVLIADEGDVIYGNLYHRSGTGDDPAYLLRVAEQYLIRSEARVHLNNLSGAAADLNQVRQRAGIADTEAVTGNELLLAIENERRIEFAFEGHRWFDLVRTGRAGDVLEVTDTDRWLFPIPLNDLNADDDLTQNNGY